MQFVFCFICDSYFPVQLAGAFTLDGLPDKSRVHRCFFPCTPRSLLPTGSCLRLQNGGLEILILQKV